MYLAPKMRWLLIVVVILAVYIGYCFVDRFDPESIRGRRVLVTGASAGIGEQLAYQYARLGASVTVTARTPSKLQRVVERCREIGSPSADFFYVTADMSQLTQTEHVIQTAVDKMGGLDILVLNHIMPNQKLETWKSRSEDLERIHKLMDINLFSYIHLASHAMPHLEDSSAGGSIVVVSSLTGKISTPGLIEYSTSKFALDGFFHGLRQELAIKESPVSVTVCILGSIGTDSATRFTSTHGIKGPTPESPSDTALAILIGGATRVRELHYPYLIIKPLVLFRDWFPDLIESMFAGTMTL